MVFMFDFTVNTQLSPEIQHDRGKNSKMKIYGKIKIFQPFSCRESSNSAGAQELKYCHAYQPGMSIN